MAKRRRKQNNAYPGWMWMLFGLAIGLAVAAAVYIKDRPAVRTVVVQADETPTVETVATPPPALDDNGETDLPEAPESRFDFYEILKKMEVEVDVAEPTTLRDDKPQAVVEEGTYVLQAGSFGQRQDAERRRAELGLQGIESRVVAADINGRTYHRVYIGPISDLERLNLLRSQLRAARIDVLRITVSK